MIDPTMGVGRDQQVDYLVVGAGIAGLRAAIDLAAGGTVLIVTKDDPSLCVSRDLNSGGYGPVTDDEDEMTVRVHETLRAGDGLCREEAVRVLAEAAAAEFKRLIEWGARFEVKNPAPHQTAGVARRSRVLRAEGSPAGREALATLLVRAKALPSLHIRPSAVAADLLAEDGNVTGVCYLDERSRSLTTVRAKAVLLATGGLGQVYAKTTHPPGACGDGVAMAHRAGALLSDLEFVQFHPTVLSTPREPSVTLSAALREKGAVLRNLELERFMARYHEAAELAPSDALARAIISEMQRGPSNFVYLDLTGLNPEHVKRDFPRLCAACLENNIDITSDLIPTHPAAHFAIGGVATDLEGSTSLNGLCAAGEAAATGVHGASPFGNNSFIESVVFGARAARAMLRGAAAARFPAPSSSKIAVTQAVEPDPTAPMQDPAAVSLQIHRLMWEMTGVMRHASKLKDALSCFVAMCVAQPHPPDRGSLEVRNLLEVARLITLCAEARKESRGTHYRADYPLRNESEPARHSYISAHTGVYFK